MIKPEVIKSDKNLLKLKFSEIDQGFLTFIKDQLWQDSATEMAGFQVTHPQIGHIIFTLRTKGKPAKAVWNKALDEASKQVDGLKKELKNL